MVVKKLCGRRCRGRILNKEKGLYCPHIEVKLPKLTKQSLYADPSDVIDRHSLSLWGRHQERSIHDIVRTLSRYGLAIHEIKLVYYRAIIGMDFKRIAKKTKWVNADAASYHYRQALKKLRNGGFKFRE